MLDSFVIKWFGFVNFFFVFLSLQAIWKTLYSRKSSEETGTLYVARNTVNARNVTDEMGDNFYASTELLNKFGAA